MLSWSTIFYGAFVSGALTAVVTAILDRARDPRPRAWAAVAAVAAAASFAAPVAWNAILRATHGQEFFTDAPVAILPASWQDTGSGVFTLALAATLLGLGPLAHVPARRVVITAWVAALIAFAVDVYLY